MQLKLNFALIAIAIASASVNALPARGYASDSNDLAARTTAEDLAYLEARYGADVDVDLFFAREDDADLFAREGEADLWAREDEADLWAREDEAEFYARDYDDWAELEARELTAPAMPTPSPAPSQAVPKPKSGAGAPAGSPGATPPAAAGGAPVLTEAGGATPPGTPTSGAKPPHGANPFKPDASDADGMLGWKMMKAVMARSADPLPPPTEAAYEHMLTGCDRILDADLKAHCIKIVKNLKKIAGEQIWGLRHFLEQTSMPIPPAALPDLDKIKPKAGHVNKKLVPGVSPIAGEKSQRAVRV